MRLSLRLFLVSLAMVSVPVMAVREARAFPITATISFVGTGRLGSTAFSDGLVTVSASFTSESLQGCGVGLDECSYPDGPPLFNENAPVITVTVPGATGHVKGDVGVGVLPGLLSIADIEGHLYFDVNSPEITATSFLQPFGPVAGTYTEDELGPNCIDKISGYCPVEFYTNVGGLTLDSIEGTATGSVAVGSDAAVTPEPGTWVMVGTGLVGGLGAVRRRVVWKANGSPAPLGRT